MCFSATASFLGGGFIFLIGLCGIFLNIFPDRAYRTFFDCFRPMNMQNIQQWWPILLTPILFSIQQVCEGFVWLSINSGNNGVFPGYMFSFFAFCFWPLWVPFVCFVLDYEMTSTMDKVCVTKVSIQIALVFIGLALCIYMMISLFGGSKLEVDTYGGHIAYRFNLLGDINYLVSTIPYLMCTLVPFFLVQRVKYIWLIGASVGGAAIASYLLYTKSFPSTWCFFAAWLSVEVVAIRGIHIVESYNARKQPNVEINDSNVELGDGEKYSFNHDNEELEC